MSSRFIFQRLSELDIFEWIHSFDHKHTSMNQYAISLCLTVFLRIIEKEKDLVSERCQSTFLEGKRKKVQRSERCLLTLAFLGLRMGKLPNPVEPSLDWEIARVNKERFASSLCRWRIKESVEKCLCNHLQMENLWIQLGFVCSSPLQSQNVSLLIVLLPETFESFSNFPHADTKKIVESCQHFL